MSHKKKWTRIAVCALSVIFVALVIFIVGRAGTELMKKRAETAAQSKTVNNDDVVQADGKTYQRKKYLKNYLVMGIDKAESSQSMTNINGQQTDFNALVVVNVQTETYSILYLNRDTMTDVSVLALDGTPYTTRYQQLALAHTYGSGMEDSCENTVNTVSALLDGVTVDHYAAFYLNAIGVLNDAVGGVTVTIEDDFSENDPTLVMGETVTLNAEQAEHYVRSRMDVADGTNLNRMKRQMNYISTWAEQASSKMAQDAGFAAALTEQLGTSIVTDLSVQQISDLAQVFEEYALTGTYQLEGEAVLGEEYMEYYLDEDELQKTMLELFYEEIEN